MYDNDDILSRVFNEHTVPDDIEIVCVEITLRKQKCFKYEHIGVIDHYSTAFDRLIMRDF